MSDVTISQGEYNDLQKAKANSERYKTEVSDLEEESKNKAIALDEERGKRKEAEKSITDITAEMETLKTNHSTDLEKFADFDSLKEWSENWTKHQDSVVAKRTENIKSYKEKLWEDFMKANESFLDWLPDDKVETYLSNNIKDEKKWDFDAPWAGKSGQDKGWTSAYETAKAANDVAGMIAAQVG